MCKPSPVAALVAARGKERVERLPAARPAVIPAPIVGKK